nr:class II aldolase/adducin family protein [uncultured Holophaga sp.]
MSAKSLLCSACLVVGLPGVILPIRAQAPPPPPPMVDAAAQDETSIRDLVDANHILYNQGVVDGFGHVSVRSVKHPDHFFISRSMAPGLVTRDDIVEVDYDGKVIDTRGRKSYLERFIHAEIYRAHPEVKAVIHSHSPAVIPFGVTSAPFRAVSHMGAFLGTTVPVFEIRDLKDDSDMLIRNPELGRALVKTMGSSPVCLMRGHGDVVVGDNLRQVVFRAIYTEMNAKLLSEAMKLGPVVFLNAKEAENAARTNDGQLNRPWELWKMKVEAESKGH